MKLTTRDMNVETNQTFGNDAEQKNNLSRDQSVITK